MFMTVSIGREYLIFHSFHSARIFKNYFYSYSDAAPVSTLALDKHSCQDSDSELEDCDIKLEIDSPYPNQSTAASSVQTHTNQRRFLLYSHKGVSDKWQTTLEKILKRVTFISRRQGSRHSCSVFWERDVFVH